MPNPFPGMNPYLEQRYVWPDMHQRLIAYISEQLQSQIRPKYIARIGERVQLATVPRSYVPDVLLVQPSRQQGGSAVLEATPPIVADDPLLIIQLDEEYHEPFIEIIARDTGDVVTLIEVLSPANKVGDGRDQYLQKQEDLLSTDVNLVEIDLLSYGKDTVLARNATIVEPIDWRYLIDLSRGKPRSNLEIYVMRLSDKLPNCRIPLRKPDGDAVLDLTAVLHRCYDVGGYDLLLDYDKAPSVSLSEAEQAWMDQMLREKGVRHS